jgi:hypothetical protein
VNKFLELISFLGGLAICITACRPAVAQTPVIVETRPVPPVPTQKAPKSLTCNTDYSRHELTAPYRQDAYDPQPIFTFAPVEFLTTLAGLGITSVCIPEGVDAPYTVFDWKVEDGTAQQGRMTTISFDAWREAQLVYATYDFIKGTEYEKFATNADYDSIKNTNSSGFERIFVGLCYGKCTVYKTFIHPFTDHYVAVTLNLGAYDYGKTIDSMVSEFNAGNYPVDLEDDLVRFDTVVNGLVFTQH